MNRNKFPSLGEIKNLERKFKTYLRRIGLEKKVDIQYVDTLEISAGWEIIKKQFYPFLRVNVKLLDFSPRHLTAYYGDDDIFTMNDGKEYSELHEEIRHYIILNLYEVMSGEEIEQWKSSGG